MPNHIIETQWMGKMQFNALINGHTLIMDAPERSGGEDNGPIPKPFVLAALSGCSGMDVIALLKKENITIDDFDMIVTGELSNQQPIEYTSIHIRYELKGNVRFQEKVLLAVKDSQEKYCGVSSLLKKAIPVTWEVNFNAINLFSNRKTPDSSAA